MTGDRFINLAHIKSQTRCWLIVVCLLANVTHSNPPSSDRRRRATDQHDFAPVASTDHDLIRVPPRIASHHPREVSLSGDKPTKSLRCRAVGHPTPIVTWHEVSNLAASELKVQNGTVNVSSGYYQCRATNSAGTAISDVTHVVPFYSIDESQWSAPTDQKEVHGVVGGSVMLRFCSVTGNVPNWSTRWLSKPKCHYKRDDEFEGDDIISPDENFTITENGDLILLNLQPEIGECDYKSKFYFYDERMNVGKECAISKLVIDHTHSAGDSHPTRLFYKSYDKTITVEDNVTLMCVFNGRLHRNITWSRVSGRPVRGNVSDYGRKLDITAIRKDDEDEYVCSVGHHVATASIHLNVDVRPHIVTPLQSHNITSGQSVNFTCSVDSKPTAKVTWFINGLSVQPDSRVSVAERYDERRTSDGQFSITFYTVRSSFGIACNVSNQYGYDFSSASLGLLPHNYRTTSPMTAAEVNALVLTTSADDVVGPVRLIIIGVVVVAVIILAVIIAVFVCCRLKRHRKSGQRENNEENRAEQEEEQEDDSMLDKRPPVAAIDVERESLASEASDHHSNLSGTSSRFPSADSGINDAPDENSAMAENIENMARDEKLLAAA